jgi:hypothetical protein
MSLPAGHQHHHNGDVQTLSHSQLAVSEEALVRFGAADYPTLFEDLRITDGAEESETFGAEDFYGNSRDEPSEGKTRGLDAEVRLGDFGNGVDVSNVGRMYGPRSSTQIRTPTHIHTHTYIHTHIHTHTHTHTHAHTHINVHTRTHTKAHTHTHVGGP